MLEGQLLGVRPMCPRSYVSIALCVQDSMCPGSYVARIFTISYGSYVSEFLCVPVSKWPGVRCQDPVCPWLYVSLALCVQAQCVQSSLCPGFYVAIHLQNLKIYMSLPKTITTNWNQVKLLLCHSFLLLFLAAIAALQVAMSVGRSVGRSLTSS